MAKKISEDAKKLVKDTAAEDRTANQIECPVCNALLAKRNGVKHCGHIYHLDNDSWEKTSPPQEEEEEIGASLLVEIEDEEEPKKEDEDAS